MNQEKRRALCLSMPGATEVIQWVDNLVFKVGGKMFLVSDLDPRGMYAFKCDDETFAELSEQIGIRPAPYMARAKWVQIDPAECRLTDAELEALIRNSYSTVFAKLTKKAQREIEENEAS